MPSRFAVCACFAVGLTTWPGPAAATRQDAVELIRRGLDLGYNLDHAEAAAAFDDAIAADPSSAAAHRLRAAAAWMAILFAQGAITIEDYLGQARSTVARPGPDAALAETFRAHSSRAIAIADAAVRARPGDADAHHQAGAAYALRASYTATVDGRVNASVGDARRAYRAEQRALALDPRRADAGLIVGTYRYTIASLSFPARLIARLAGFDGGRQRGIELVEGAAALASDAQPSARFMLVLLYNREKRYDDALRVVADLRRTYPRNRLLWLETGSTALRAGRPAEAITALERGLALLGQDRRPRAGGELSRWHLTYGTALAARGQSDEATRELNGAIQTATRDWVRGRARYQLGALLEQRGDRGAARAAFLTAGRLCAADDDNDCVKDARAATARLRK